MNADHLAELLAEIAVPIARTTPRQPTDAATPEQLDVVIALRELARTLQEFTELVPQRQPGADVWEWLAEVLGEAARLCREQVVIEQSE